MKNKENISWIKNRQSIIWEPELLISGIVLIGLLQVPKLLDRFTQYLNDWGPTIFYTSNLDEVLAAFLKTSVIFLIGGLVFNLFLRSIWVVMVGMSYLFPHGFELKKFKFQPYFEKKFEKIGSFQSMVIRMDKICSFTYTLTFFAFMCVIGLFFFLLTVGGTFSIIYSNIAVKNDFTESLMNNALNIFMWVFGGIYFLDFITLGWFKRIKWLSIAYRPVYVVMSVLTLAPLYRGIYYALLSRFNRWKIFVSLIGFIFMVWYLLLLQLGDDFLINKSRLISQSISVSTYDGYYRDMIPDKISNWAHIPSATVEKDVLEVFVAHKAALEDSVLVSFERISGMKKDQILQNDSIKLEAMRSFYRFKLNDQMIDPIPYQMFNFSQYHQKGLLGFIALDSVPVGQHTLNLYLNYYKPALAAHLVFYKTENGSKLKKYEELP